MILSLFITAIVIVCWWMAVMYLVPPIPNAPPLIAWLFQAIYTVVAIIVIMHIWGIHLPT